MTGTRSRGEHYGQRPWVSAASKGRTHGSTDQPCITSKSSCQQGAVHTWHKRTTYPRLPNLPWIEASSRSFLHNQVRSRVGSLKLVGDGKWTAGDLKKALEARKRTACGPVAPACGLYLVRVDY